MINIVKKHFRRKIHELNTLIGSSDDSQPRAQNKYIAEFCLLQNNYYRITAASTLQLSSANKAFVLSETKPVHIFMFSLKLFAMELPSVSVLKHVHIQVIFLHELLKLISLIDILLKKSAKHKVKYIYLLCKSVFARETPKMKPRM